MADFLTRFAPSPTGQLHLGHAASAWHVWHAAARADGRVLLRIEDIDTTRCRPEYAQQILTDLHWLGFDWPEPVRVQSEHFAEYERVVAQLDGLGLAYRCFLTRSDLEHTTPAPLDAEQEAGLLAAGKPFAWRLSLARARDYLGPAWDALTYS
ncbi:MAG: tRNA glutamyl-Q(34) synthetase GluQRS, partial [Alphaproteobacteria bacterium]|nr:tRNA glutamyl-Q(34) synthetase GluQRS [Alphaproteobacteria bacterium]